MTSRLSRKLNRLYLEYNRRLAPDLTLGSPSSIQIEISSVCNLDCITCDYNLGYRKGHNQKNISSNEFRRIIEMFPHLSQVTLHGNGEPLFNPEIFDIIKILRAEGIRSSLATNATLLTEEKSKNLIQSGLGRIHFSIDAANKRLFEKIRKGAIFEKICENIKEFINIKNRVDLNIPLVGVNTVVTKRNIHDIPNIMKLCKSLGISHLLLQFPYPIQDKEFDKIMISPKQWLSLQGYEKLSKELELDVGHYPKKEVHDKSVPCDWPWTSTFITAEGYVTPCCYCDNPEWMNMGNVFRQDFNTIWNNRLYKEFREDVKRRNHKICEKCPNVILTKGL